MHLKGLGIVYTPMGRQGINAPVCYGQFKVQLKVFIIMMMMMI